MAKKKFDHSRKLTNPDYDLSDCFNCYRNKYGMCVINGMQNRYIAVTSHECKRCGYWYPRCVE